jgi:acyl-ACP thioesterase
MMSFWFTLKELTIDLRDIAKTWVVSNDHEQAKLFNELGRAMRAVNYNTETQFCYMADDLDENGKWLIEEIAGFVKLEREAQEKKITG